MLPAINPRYLGMEGSFVLEKVQTTPTLLFRIVDSPALCVAFGTNKSATGRKIELKTKTTFIRVKLIGNHNPRIHPYSLLKKFFVFHNRPLYVSQNTYQSAIPAQNSKEPKLF
jgi:hypothetical protein